jgi:hypothetical protein
VRAWPAIALGLSAAACGRSELGVSGPAGPGSACLDSPSEPVRLQSIGAFSDYDRVNAITAAGSDLYYAVNDGSNVPVAIFRAPIAGGAATPVVVGVPGCASSPFGYGVLVSDGRRLFTQDEEEVSLCGGASLDVTAYDLSTGTVSTLPNPPSQAMRYVAQVRAVKEGGALWLYVDEDLGGTTWLVKWDGTTTSELVEIPDQALDFVVSGDRALVWARKTLYDVTLTGAPAASAVAMVDDSKFGFVGANATAFFYTEDRTSIERRDAVSGQVTTIATGVSVAAVEPDSLWADDSWVYVRLGQTGTSFPAELGRVPAMGGPVETLYADTTREGIQAVTSDRCNVYWVAGPSFDASEPPALFAVGR